MERSPGASKRVSKSQRTLSGESHSEIERKRRERMKRDTEFLRKQVSHTQCKDKLSIFQAGAEKLIQYTDKLGKREYIINDEEYSQIIMNNFDGFDIHVRCSDGKVLSVHENVKKILDVAVDEVVGRSLQDLAEPSHITRQIISDAFRCLEFQWDIFKGVIARNFTIALRCGTRIPSKHCIYGCDGNVYRFIEFCGDLVPHTDEIDSKLFTVFRGLCRPLDPVSSTVIEPSGNVGSANPEASVRIPRSACQFTLRLAPDTFLITEVVGNFQEVLGVGNSCNGQAVNLLNKHLPEIVHPCDRVEVEQRLLEVWNHRRPITFPLRLIHSDSGAPINVEVRLSAICLGAHLHCFVCRFVATELPKHMSHLCPISPEKVPCEGTVSFEFKPRTYNSPTSPGHVTIEGTSEISALAATRSDLSSSVISVLQLAPALGPPTSTVDYKAESAVIPGSTLEEQHPDQNMDESWLREVDTSSFQSLLDNYNPTVDSEYFMDIPPEADPDI